MRLLHSKIGKENPTDTGPYKPGPSPMRPAASPLRIPLKYSDKTTLTEYFDLMNEPNGTPMFVVTIVAADPVYLSRNFVISSQFKKEPGDTNAKWKPTECSAKW